MPIDDRFDKPLLTLFDDCPAVVDRNIIHIFDKDFTYYIDLNSKQEWQEESRHAALDRSEYVISDTIKHGCKQYWYMFDDVDTH